MEGISWHFDYVRLAWDAGFCFDSQRTRNAFDLSSLGNLNDSILQIYEYVSSR